MVEKLIFSRLSATNLVNDFKTNGFVLIRNLYSVEQMRLLEEEFEAVFGNIYGTGLIPDKVKFSSTFANSNTPISIVNAWKSNKSIKELFMNPRIGQIAAKLMGWHTVKLNQDALYKIPTNSSSTSYHTDNPYQLWHDSNGGIITAWFGVDDINEMSGGIEYFAGSHKIKNSKRLTSNFFSKLTEPFDGDISNTLGLNYGERFKKVVPELKKGDVLFHHGDLWHGASKNKGESDRRACSLHIMSGDAKFSKRDISPYFNKYKLNHSEQMVESFFPDYKIEG